MKDAHTRLMDMLWGWCMEEDDSPHIGELYEQVGEMENPTDDDIRAFVQEKVIPLLLTGK
jgi:hypothetical protein